MSDTKVYKRGTVMLRQGDPGDCMYVVQSGRVGIFENYGQPQDKKIAELMSGEYFGEMSLLDHEPRSATAVVLEEAMITTVTEETFLSFFKENPAKVLMIAQQMSHRLRRTTQDYIEACKTVYDTVEAEKAGRQKDENLMKRIAKLCAAHLVSRKGAEK